MSAKNDDKAKEVTEQAHDAPSQDAESGGAGGFIILFFVLGFAASLVVGWVVFPKLLYSQKKSTVRF